MKPEIAIVERAPINIDLIAEQIIVAASDERQADASRERHEGLAASARATAQQRRLEIGRLLTKARAAWPERGKPPAGVKGSWAEFLARVGMTQPTAWNYMELAKSALHSRADEGDPQSRREAGLDSRPLAADRDDDEPVDVLGQQRETPPFRQQTEDELFEAIARLAPEARKRLLGRANVKGGSNESARGAWCTSREWAQAVGQWDHDPFSNPRSHILSVTRCMLEDGGDAFGGGEPGATPGLYLTGSSGLLPGHSAVADELTRVFIQPPFKLVLAAILHYGHTRFCALLRWSPDVKEWFPDLWRRTAVVCHPWCERMEFEPPPGVPSSGDMPYPHALYYAHEADVTDEVRRRCIVWRIDHDLDDARPRSIAELANHLTLVR